MEAAREAHDLESEDGLPQGAEEREVEVNKGAEENRGGSEQEKGRCMKSAAEKKALEVADGDSHRVEEQVKNIHKSSLNIGKEKEGNNDKAGRKLKMITRIFEEQRRINKTGKEWDGQAEHLLELN
ncbi:uncharacterized protein DS421_12g366300 [Arachis hypogaea]|nr:uncharacterized protein DS421_12g366300 [Arachis hypogaea]